MKFKYKMRAECLTDIGRFLFNVHVTSLGVGTYREIPDVFATFTSDLSLAEIKAQMSNIVDGHVMLETVALEKDYTGERK